MPNGRRRFRRGRRQRGRGGGLGRQWAPRALEAFINRTSFNVPIRILLSGEINLTSDGSGNISGLVTCDPSGGSGSTWTSDEWGGVANRYGQVRCVGIRVLFVSSMPFGQTETKAENSPIAISNSILSQTAPSSYAVCIDNSGFKMWNPQSDTSRAGIRQYLTHDLKSLGWQSTGQAFGGVPYYSGCPGGVGYYGSGFPVSTRHGSIFVTGVYEFRGKN